MMTSLEATRLHWADYVVFCSTLVACLAIGVYHAIVGEKHKTTSEYFLGGRSMGLVPVTLSLVVSYISTITLIGYPAEMFGYGVQYYWFTLAVFLGMLMSAFIFVPLFFPLKITSVNEYLYLRYQSRAIQYIGSVCGVVNMVFYLGSVYYGPAVAIESVSGLPTWTSIIIIGAVSIVYTSIGGFKAVIYTDVFQSFIMLAGMIAVLIQGIIIVGGFQRMWDINKEWGRLNFFDFDPNPTKRINFYGAVFGNAFTVMAVFGYSQTGVQRYLAMPTMAKSKLCLLGMVPGNVLMQTLAMLCGLTMFAYYAYIGCDPKNVGLISSYNQLMPYFVSSIFSYPIIPGLFLAALYSASLSTASTLLNASAACIWRDILDHKFPALPQWKVSIVNKVVTSIVGVIGVVMALGVSAMKGGTLVQIISLTGAATGGPSFALFLMGAFFPWVNWKGAAIASVMGSAFGMWISIGNYLYGNSWTPLPSPSSNCSDIFNISMTTSALHHAYDVTTMASFIEVNTEPSGLNRLYSLSFLWMREATTAVCLVLAIIMSAITGFRKASTVEEQFMHPLVRYCCKLKPNEYSPVKTKEVVMELQTLNGHRTKVAVDEC